MQITGRITILVLCLTFLPTKFSNAEEKWIFFYLVKDFGYHIIIPVDLNGQIA